MAGYTVTRSVTVDAPVSRLHELVADFHHWTSWSPWEGLDPDLQRTYSGPDGQPGARYEWSGNRRAGRGSMEITATSEQSVDLTVEFLKPFKSTSRTRFLLAPTAGGTEVTWEMSGEQTGAMAIFGKVVKMDRLIGPDFEKGLARLKAVAEESA